MSDTLGHDAARELLALAALNALAPEERASLDAHLAVCAECGSELAALRDAAASIGAALPPRPMDPEREAEVRARLLSRAIEDRANVRPIRATKSARVNVPLARAHAAPSRARWLAAAATIVAIGAIAYDFNLRSVVHQLSESSARLADSTSVLERRLAEEQAMVADLTGPGVRVIDANATNGRQPYARMFWDQPMNRWTFVAHNLPVATAGHTYQLWLVMRDQKKVSAGTFTPSPNGTAMVHATYAVPADSLAAVAVTSEPMGGSAQPTSTPFLVGAMASRGD